MKKLILAVFGLVVMLTGCTKQAAAPVVCNVLFQATTAAAQGVATALSCSNVPAIAATLSDPITKLNLCAPTASGLIGDMVCGQVANVVLGIGLQQLPADWKCTGGVLGTSAKTLITDKCKAAVPF